jgi:hypothetical protein
VAATLRSVNKETPKPAKVTPAVDKAPCKAGEVLKNAKKPFDAKKNPCVAKPVKK